MCEGGKYWGAEQVTNNVAEYRGLILGLEAAERHAMTNIRIEGDSKLVISQVKGDWKVNKPHLRPLAEKARELSSRAGVADMRWIPREQNSHADSVCNRCLDSRSDTGDSAALSDERASSADASRFSAPTASASSSQPGCHQGARGGRSQPWKSRRYAPY